MVEKNIRTSFKEKKALWEEFLGVVTCEPMHDSHLILVFSHFVPRDSYNWCKQTQL